MVRDLRSKTGAGIMACKEALNESDGDFDKAVEFLRKKGLKTAEKRSDRSAGEGTIHAYIHPGSKVGVLLELNSETDFVARGNDFQKVAQEIAMHIAWAAPRFLAREDVPESVLSSEREIYRSQIKPEQQKMAEKIVEGKLEKFFAENCLLEQLDARDPSGKRTIAELIQELSGKVGERIVLKRFARFALGDEPVK